jgi:hypothetical protein
MRPREVCKEVNTQIYLKVVRLARVVLGEVEVDFGGGLERCAVERHQIIINVHLIVILCDKVTNR